MLNDWTKQILLWAVILVILVSVFHSLSGGVRGGVDLPYSEFLREVRSDNIQSVEISADGGTIVGKRKGFGKENFAPHSMVLTMIGTGMLWVGWYGFNAGSAVAADGVSSQAFLTTTLATAVACAAWPAAEWISRGKPSVLGFCSGAVGGLVVITPCAGFVTATGAVIIGVLAGIVPFFACTKLKTALAHYGVMDLEYNDTLEIVVLRMFASQSAPDIRFRLAGAVLQRVLALVDAGLDFRGDSALEAALLRIGSLRGQIPDSVADAAISATYRIFQRPELEIVDGAVVPRQIPGPPDADGNPTFITPQLPPSMAAQNARGSRFFTVMNNGTHAGMLSPAELRLISEWLDIGAQYYNDPFPPTPQN